MVLRKLEQMSNNLFRKIKRKAKSRDEALEQMEELYEDSIEGIDDIISSLQYYKKDVENLKSDIRRSPKYYATTVHSSTQEAPDLISIPYSEYKKEKPLLTGDESYSDMETVVGSAQGWNRFCRVADDHISILREMKSDLREALDEVRDARETLKRQQYKQKAAEQRDESFNIDSDELSPDLTPSKLSKKLSEDIQDELDEDKNNEKDEEDQMEDANLMMPYQIAFFVIEHLRNPHSEKSDVYRSLRAGFPEQAEKIEQEIYSVSSLERKAQNMDGMLPLDDTDIQYIQDYVQQPDKMIETPQQYREKHR